LLDVLGHHTDAARHDPHVGFESRFPCAIYHEAVLDQDV